MHSTQLRGLFLILLLVVSGWMVNPAQMTVRKDVASTITLSTAPLAPLPTSGAGKSAYVIPVHGEFENALYLILVRALRQASERNADAIILDMNSPGGRVDAAIQIRDLLIESGGKIPIIAYVNPSALSACAFMALATDKIVMGPNSSIGAALPITMNTKGGADAADAKFISAFTAEMRKTAKTKGHPVDIAEGFANPDKEIPGLKAKGEILTLDFEQATSVGLAQYSAADLTALLAHEGLAGAEIERFQESNVDRLARFLSSSVVMGLLLLIGLSGIFIELKSPGTALPGIIGLLAIGLYFMGSYLANMSGYIEWILFIGGIVLLILEIYVIPGFGIAGILGIVMVVGSLFFALFNFGPDGFDFNSLRLEAITSAALTVVLGFVGMVILLIAVAKYLPKTPGLNWVVLQPVPEQGTIGTPQAPEIDAAEISALAIGDLGMTASILKPTGVAVFHGRRIDVLTEGEYLKNDEAVEIHRIEGARIFVRRV